MTRHRPAPPPSAGLTTSWQHQATERLPDPVLLIGSAGNVESCNQAARLHFGLELTIRPYAELVAPEIAEPLGAAVAGVLRGESPTDTRLNYHTAGFQPMESRFYPFIENNRGRSCIVSSTVRPGGNGHDVTTGDGVAKGTETVSSTFWKVSPTPFFTRQRGPFFVPQRAGAAATGQTQRRTFRSAAARGLRGVRRRG